MSQIRRRRLFVDPKLQGALLSHVTLYWFYCLLTVSFIAVVWIVFVKQPPTSSKLFEELWTNCGPAILGSVMLLPLVLLDCLRLSNRFAGPMVRLNRALKDLANGEIPQHVHVRNGDFWSEFAQSVNGIIDRQPAANQSPEATPTVAAATEELVETGSNPTPVVRNSGPPTATSIYSDLTA